MLLDIRYMVSRFVNILTPDRNRILTPKQDALDFLPGYDYDGPMDDDVIEDADMPIDGSGISIKFIH